MSNIIFFILSLVTAINSNDLTGPVGSVNLISFDTCAVEPPNGDITAYMEYKLAEDGIKKIFGNFTLKVPFDKDIMYQSIVYKWHNSGWKLMTRHERNFCQTVTTFLSRVWEKFVSALEPPVIEECSIQPGFYTVQNFSTTIEDFDFNNYIYGHLLRKTYYFKENKMVLCLQSEGIFQKRVK